MTVDNVNDISPIIIAIVLIVWVILCKRAERKNNEKDNV